MVVNLTSLSCRKKVSDGGSLVARTSERVRERNPPIIECRDEYIDSELEWLWWVTSVRMWRVGEPKFGGVAAFMEGPRVVTFCVLGFFFFFSGWFFWMPPHRPTPNKTSLSSILGALFLFEAVDSYE